MEEEINKAQAQDDNIIGSSQKNKYWFLNLFYINNNFNFN